MSNQMQEAQKDRYAAIKAKSTSTHDSKKNMFNQHCISYLAYKKVIIILYESSSNNYVKPTKSGKAILAKDHVGNDIEQRSTQHQWNAVHKSKDNLDYSEFRKEARIEQWIQQNYEVLHMEKFWNTNNKTDYMKIQNFEHTLSLIS